MFFGVDETGGVATSIPGLTGINTDAEILRIESVIQSNIDPRVPGVQSKAILMPHGAPVIVVHVPKSWRSPHLVKINDTFRMYGRNSKGKYIFDAQEIRSAFALSEELPERIRRWRDDRIAKILGGDTPVPIKDGARLCIHLLPLSSFVGNVEVSASELSKKRQAFLPPDTTSANFRINIDGAVTYSGSGDETRRCSEYCQVFRSCRIEAVSTQIVSTHETMKQFVSSTWFESTMIQSVREYLLGLKEHGVLPPIILLVAISGTKGVKFAVSNQWSYAKESRIDRDMLLLPEVLIETEVTDLPTLLRPIFDAAWNSAGWEQSKNYDASGAWKPT